MGFFDTFTESLEKSKDSAFPDKKTMVDDANPSLLVHANSDKKTQQSYNEDIFKQATGQSPSNVLWQINGEDWYKYYGYLFTVKFHGEDNKNTNFHYMLPIPPSSYLCKPVLPSQLTSTFGGVIEEVSSVKFWLISFEGTTGIAGGRDSSDLQREKLQTRFRDTVATTGLLSGVFAEANGAANKLAGIVDRHLDRNNALTWPDAAQNVKGSLNDALTPPIPYASSAVHNKHNGFVEAYTMKKFFYLYHTLKSYAPKDYSLHFTNLKTDQSWKIVIKDFTLQQNASNPFLIRYNISLQGWDIKQSSDATGIEKSKLQPFDRFGANGDLKEVNSVNVKDVFNKVKQKTTLIGSLRSIGK